MPPVHVHAYVLLYRQCGDKRFDGADVPWVRRERKLHSQNISIFLSTKTMDSLFNFGKVTTEYIWDYVGLFMAAEVIIGVLVVKNLLVRRNCDKLQTSALIFSAVYSTLCSFKNFSSDKYNEIDLMGDSDDALARMFCAISYAFHITYIVSNNSEVTKDIRVKSISSKVSLVLALLAPFINLDIVYTFLSSSQVVWTIACIVQSRSYKSARAVRERQTLVATLIANIVFLVEYNLYMFVFPDSVWMYGACNLLEAITWGVYHSMHETPLLPTSSVL
jgi:hypothetical protein